MGQNLEVRKLIFELKNKSKERRKIKIIVRSKLDSEQCEEHDLIEEGVT
jgi:hypothetical protein